MQGPEFADIALRYETLVQQLRDTKDPQRRKQLLRHMSGSIRDFDAFVHEYLRAFGVAPSSEVQKDAVRIAQELLNDDDKVE